MTTEYYISFNNVDWSQIYPSNSPAVKWAHEAGEMFMRYKVDSIKIGSVKNASIYSTIETMFFAQTTFSDALYFKITKSSGDKLFRSSVNEAKLDKQNNVFEILRNGGFSFT